MDLRGIQDLLATVILLGTCGPTGVVPWYESRKLTSGAEAPLIFWSLWRRPGRPAPPFRVLTPCGLALLGSCPSRAWRFLNS